MEIGIVTSSQESFDSLCKDENLNPDDVYVISSANDLSKMLQECEGSKVNLLFAYDAAETNVTRNQSFEDVYRHNRVLG